MSTPDLTSTSSTVPTRRSRPLIRPRRKFNLPLTILLVVCTLTVLVPFFVTVSMAFKTGSQAVQGQAFTLPSPVSIEGFVEAWRLTDFPVSFAISVFVSAIAVAGAVLISTMAAYSIYANWERRFFRFAFFYILAAMFLPFPVLALSQIKLSGMVGLDTPLGVGILHIMFHLGFNVLLLTTFLRNMPPALEEAARIDGASTWQTFWRIIFPVLAPMSATVGIFAFLFSWNDFMMPSMIISDPSLQTLPVVNQLFQSQFSSNYHVSFASYLMALAPSILVFVFTQRWVLSGVTQGAVK
ncbi:carbohydrate ABC transporter permease [Nesterenkonia xinjiangensis]|uniref:Raffinose/stachyose/melibiose transport system permease protein n=1 Tax=Nesterenkonia xinjiangensis TaxID=225327 RepID=A0A7Z0GN32_9MICC|nr:carbohydrate ABC transporter permease [Nesterenkonia xinjiangensis]NYJ78136.1 raffinose/stachyose/melibiose transport system permease protein [Nesterenkonia xinjiangensis]